MLKAKIHSDIFYYTLAFGILTIPFSIFFQLPVILILLLNFITELHFKEKYQSLKSNSLLPFFILFSGFYLLYVIGTIYSSNLRYAFSDLECKLFLFLMPFFIFTQKKEDFTKEKTNKLFFLFIIAVLAMIICNFSISFFNFVKNGDEKSFFYTQMSHFTHPSYSALYANTAFLMALHFLFINPIKEKSLRIIFATTLPIIATYIFLVQSKAGVIVFLLTATAEAVCIIWKTRHKFIIIISLAIICCMGVMLISRHTHVFDRLGQSLAVLQNGTLGTNPQGSTDARIAVWKSALQAGGEHIIFGVGTGDVKETLIEHYRASGYTYIANKQFNAHNQYLQTFVALGMIGLLMLAAALLYPFAQALRMKHYTTAIWWFSIICNLLVECMFEVRAGCDFIATIGCLLCYYINAFDKPTPPPLQTQQ
ncbi:MAG: O-antigen ligase family protein [Bacteroidales bacterium]|nr:O-antigen ligase family protein [Bacteroidales bacterium]